LDFEKLLKNNKSKENIISQSLIFFKERKMNNMYNHINKIKKSLSNFSISDSNSIKNIPKKTISLHNLKLLHTFNYDNNYKIYMILKQININGNFDDLNESLINIEKCNFCKNKLFCKDLTNCTNIYNLLNHSRIEFIKYATLYRRLYEIRLQNQWINKLKNLILNCNLYNFTDLLLNVPNRV
jgi:hypothetical protein